MFCKWEAFQSMATQAINEVYDSFDSKESAAAESVKLFQQSISKLLESSKVSPLAVSQTLALPDVSTLMNSRSALVDPLKMANSRQYIRDQVKSHCGDLLRQKYQAIPITKDFKLDQQSMGLR